MKQSNNNPFYKVALQKALRMISNPTKAKQTIKKAMNKSEHFNSDESFLSQLKDNLILFVQMLTDYFRGEYKQLPKSTLVKMLAAVLYFVFLVDLIPDFLIGVGLTDDAAVFAWVVTSIFKDIQDYKDWKSNTEDIDIIPIEIGE